VTGQQAIKLLRAACEAVREVNPKRLGAAGPDAFEGAYACVHGVGDEAPIDHIPFVVETWAEALDDDEDSELSVFVNKTPVTGDIEIARDKKEINFFGCGLRSTVAQTTKTAQFNIHLNVITPFMPITSDGKAPDFDPFFPAISDAVGKVVRKAHRPNSRGVSQKSVVLDHLDEVIAETFPVHSHMLRHACGLSSPPPSTFREARQVVLPSPRRSVGAGRRDLLSSARRARPRVKTSEQDGENAG
jgi:hypothetical protein